MGSSLADCFRNAIGALGLLLSAALYTAAARAEVEDPRHAQVDAVFAELAEGIRPGAAVGIYRGGKVQYLQGYGYADLEQKVRVTPETVFHVASVSKMFAAFSVALLQRGGSLELDADIRTYLPRLPDFGFPISVRDLVQHTSGLREQWTLLEIGGHGLRSLLLQKQVIALVERQRALNFQPGTEMEYSNTGYTLLAEVIHAVTGDSLRSFSQRRIFSPLGMSSTFFYDDVSELVPKRANSYSRDADGRWRRALLNYETVGATGLQTTASDLLRWAENFSRPRIGDARLMADIAASGTLRDGTPINYGFGLMRARFAGQEALYHTGSDAGFGAVFAYFPDHDLAIVILMNSRESGVELRSACPMACLEKVAAIYLDAGAGQTEVLPKEVEPAKDIRSALPGYYLGLPGRRARIFSADGQLWFEEIGWDSPEAIVFRDDGSFDFGDRRNPWGWTYRVERHGVSITGLKAVATLQGAKPVFLARVDNVEFPTSRYSEYAGEFRSTECDTTYRFWSEDGRLLAESLWTEAPLAFQAVAPDRFESASGAMSSVMAQRDASGKIVGFKVYGRGIRHLLLEKVH